MIFESGEDRIPEHAPVGYRPHHDEGPVVYDDEWDDLDCLPMWRRDFAGGNNRMHFVLVDEEHEFHCVEQVSLGGDYEVYGPGYGDRFDNVYDAFWTAECHAKMGTDPAHPVPGDPAHGDGC